MKQVLNLPGTVVTGYQLVEGYICLEFKFKSQGINCFHCQEYTEEFHQTTWLLVRDLA